MNQEARSAETAEALAAFEPNITDDKGITQLGGERLKRLHE